jgi:hypothetical protein
VVIRATVADGLAGGADYTKDFTITVSAASEQPDTEPTSAPPAFVPVTDITGVPSEAVAGVDLVLAGAAEPAGATNQTITWRVESAGDTGAVIRGNTFTAAAAGTAVVRATVADGLAAGADYAKDFAIIVSAATSEPPAKSGDATLADLAVSAGTLTPAFAPDVTDYAVSVSNGTSRIVLTAAAADAKAVVTGGGEKGLSVGRNTFIVTVIAEDGTALDYTVVVTRASGGSGGGSPGGGSGGSSGGSSGGISNDSGPSTSSGGGASGSGPAAGSGSQTQPNEIPIIAASLPFVDVPRNAWYYSDVAWAYKNGLMVGTSAGEFSPNMPLTRGMLATVLHRLAGGPSVNGELIFSDVAEGAWYAKAIAWAKENGIVSGVGDNLFAPNEHITREQAAAILLNYTNYAGHAPQGAWAVRLDFADVDQISDWATNGAMYCYMNGIIGGKPGKVFDPQGSATRAEIAAIMHRLVETLNSGAK